VEAGLTRAPANAFEVSPSALTIPGMDADIGLMHTLFALEDLRGLTIGKLDGEITRGGLRLLAVHLHRCKTFLENIKRKQALAFGLMATGRRFFYILWKFCGVDFQKRLFVSKQMERHSSFEN